ncbi:hypothetical protein LMG28688_04918 [Paraburkholderia caffeinitolerans]|uniref:DUF2169 domain-containing protein n=1 Tax=Paraburkholderia caffeinitolerans TaxID=1723730 RepID=A0A6J5GES3_9BURK|nr:MULTISPECIES: pentapeptide repeat-containing protein [Paraburkholderia]CAB3799342.1 hypothetical protein LMG28688_04918 [Paraburkholderia caffeinitolerans]
MKIIKPMAAGIVTRIYRLDGIERLGVAMPVMTTLEETPCIMGEQELMRLAPEVLRTAMLDAGYAKPHAEFLVAANAFATHCDAQRTSRVGVEFGGCAKHLAVAFPETLDEASIALDEFMPLAIDTPERRALYGEWDQASAAADPFGFPPAFERAWFNVAPPDQQRHDLQAWPDAVPWRIAGMHPIHARQQGTLLPLRGRCFVIRQGAACLEPVPMRLSTVWFMPDRERAILVFHGETPVEQFDANDIESLMLAIETPDEPRSMEHYAQVHAKRTHAQDAALHSLVDADLMPSKVNSTASFPDPTPSGPAWQNSMQRYGERLMHEAQARAHAAQPTTLAGAAAQPSVSFGALNMPSTAPALPRMSELADFVAKNLAMADEATAQARANAVAARTRMAAQPGVPQGAGAGRRGPPQIKRLMDTLRATPAATPLLQPDLEGKLLAMYRQSAQHQDAAFTASPEASQSARIRLREKLVRGESLAGEDLTGIDLSGLDLRGADLSNALMESANLSGTDLSEATLAGAVLVRATLHRTQLTGANLSEANLSLANCEETSFKGTTLDRATCEKAIFRRCDFSAAHLERTALRECEWEAPRFAGAALNDLVIAEQTFSGADFSGTTIRKMSFVQCTLQETSFDNANIEGFGFLSTRASQLRFDGAMIRKACFIKDTRLDATRFAGAALTEVNFRSTTAPGLYLAGARTAQCDFSDAMLTGANLRGAHLRDAMMIRTDLTDADLSNSDLIGAFMRGANLTRAKLAGANLFRALLAEARLDDLAGLDAAYTVQTTWVPRARAAA